MEFYIIRHAQSANNALLDQRQRVQDPPLTELGYRQAEIVAQHLATGVDPEQKIDAPEGVTAAHGRQGYGLTRLYCSAMHRSLQTAWPIARAVGLVPEVWIDIHESGGIYLDHLEDGVIRGYPGKTRSEILAEFPDCTLPEGLTEEGWWRGSRETHWECSGRAMKVAEKLSTWAGNGERVGIVTHGAFIDTLIKALMNQLPGRNLYYHHYNTAITRIDFNPEGVIDIRYINRFDHLPPELVT
jgi:2,3-bisphosphoglycerate-dependent phosphoglycerate mutase